MLNEHVLRGIVDFVQEGGRCVKRACTGGGGKLLILSWGGRGVE